MTKPIQTIGDYEFHGWDKNGNCLCCGYKTEQDEPCLCDEILYYLDMASSWRVSNHFQDLYLEKGREALQERDFYMECRRNGLPRDEFFASDGR